MYRRALIVAFVSAAVTVALFVLYLRRFERESSGGERVRVLVALAPLERGKAITDEALTVREVPQAYVEDRAVREVDKGKVLGLRVGGLVQAQETLMWTDLTVATEDRRDLSALVQPGSRAATIRMREDGTGSMVRPGDYVDVIGVSQGTNGESRSAAVLLQRVLVLAVGNSMSSEAAQSNGADSRSGELTLSVSLPEAQLLAAASERGALSVVVRSPDDTRTADRVPNVTIGSMNDLPQHDELRAMRHNGVSAPREVRSAGDLHP
jgi:pilus assembly protein CpaB